MDMRDKTELTFGEAMLHLSQCFNKRVFQMMHQAIMKEIESVKQNAIASCDDAQHAG